jgi:cytochrome c553
LSQDYPSVPPAAADGPWLKFDFRTDPGRYIAAVYAYVLEGNVEADWDVQNNLVRKWYHAPWMHAGDHGREYIRGLTRERTTPRPPAGQNGELGPAQTACAQNWAVGFFNAPGGYTVGQVWSNPDAPDAAKSRFPEGTVVAKLLFTAAGVTQVPYLAGALEWQANVNDIPPSDLDCHEQKARTRQTVWLLQMDLAVRDSRADSSTGWVFATYSFDGGRPGASPWEKMIPVGVMWGNDPLLTASAYASGQRTNETWINPDLKTPQHLGWLRRLNGPVDNSASSCLSCHATAEVPAALPMIPPATMPEANRMRWFQNYKAGQAFDPSSISTDYSLQIAFGIQAFRAAHQPPAATVMRPGAAKIQINGREEFQINRGD